MSLYDIVYVEDFNTILALIQGGCEVDFESLEAIVRCHNQRLSDNDHYELLKEILKRKDCPVLSIEVLEAAYKSGDSENMMLLWKDGRCCQGYDDILFHLVDTYDLLSKGFVVVHECIQKGMTLTERGISAILLCLLFDYNKLYDYNTEFRQIDMLHFCIENFESAREKYPAPHFSKDLPASILQLITLGGLNDYFADDMHLLNHQTRKLLKTACLTICNDLPRAGENSRLKKFIDAIEELEANHKEVLRCLYEEPVQPHVAKEIITTVLCEYI